MMEQCDRASLGSEGEGKKEARPERAFKPAKSIGPLVRQWSRVGRREKAAAA